MPSGESLFERDMSARFSELKEAGSGTVFSISNSEQSLQGDTTVDLVPGAIIGGVYKIIRLIGRGGMGEVYLAKHLTLAKNCALKVIPPDQLTDVSWQRFQLEAKVVARLEHVNLVRVTDLGMHEGCLPFYAMEYIEGKNLAEMLADYGPMPLAIALEIFIQVCDGIECAHRSGVMHRDLKPANIMLIQTPKGKFDVKILDFGLAKLLKHNRFRQSLTAVGDVFGSPSYMSPEQVGDDQLDNRSDIYSIGCTFFECLTGRPPFVGTQAAAVFFGHLESNPPSLEQASGTLKFPQSIEAVMAKMLRKDPNARYQTLSAVKADLELIASGQDDALPRVYEETNPLNVSQWYQIAPARSLRPKMQLVLGIALAVLCGLGSAFYYYFSSRQPIKVEGSTERLSSPYKLAPIVVPSKALYARPGGVGGDGASTADAGVGQTGSGTAPGPNADAAERRRHRRAHRDVADQGSWDGTPFYKGIVQRGAQQFSHWSYAGRHGAPVALEFEGESGMQKRGLRDDLYIPVSSKVCLFPLKTLIKRPELQKGLEGANFDELGLERYPLVDVEALTPAVAGCKSIKAVRIGNDLWSADDSGASVEEINQFQNLERLLLFAPYEGSSLAKIHRLKELKELRLNSKQPYLQDCLKVISGSKNLLSLGVSNWIVPPRDLELVVKCPNLERLMIGQLSGSHEQLSILAKLARLKQLDMPDLLYRPDLVADLRRLKSLKTLKFLLTSDWTNDKIAQLRHDLPNVQLFMYATLEQQRQSLSLR
jgi:serine/threonine protein kinase